MEETNRAEINEIETNHNIEKLFFFKNDKDGTPGWLS